MRALKANYQPFCVSMLQGADGPIIAASDYMKVVPDQLAPWLSSRLVSLGTDGFGRSDNREYLRRHFEVDRHYVAVAALHHGLCDVAVVSHGESGRSQVGVSPRRDTAIPGQLCV